MLTIKSLLPILILSCVAFSEVHAQSSEYTLVTWWCKPHDRHNNENFLEDSLLNSFYNEVDSLGYINLQHRDTFSYLRQVLNRAKDISSHVCLLPFLRIFDKDADTVISYTCFTSSYTVRHKIYCEDRSIQFVILFAVNFSFIEPFRLKYEERFEDIKLVKKNTTEDYILNTNDYAKLYDLYMNWLRDSGNAKKIIRKDPLTNSEYAWVIRTSPRLTEDRLKVLRKRRAR